MNARYALYACPAPEGAHWQSASRWLGRCAWTGATLEQPAIDGVGAQAFRALTAAPRRYGFHATLKAPFRLAAATSREELRTAVERFAASERAFAGSPLVPRRLGRFLALVNEAPDPRVASVAARCVAQFDRFRATGRTEELERHRAASALTPLEDALLSRWGYPYVMEAFRFHYSLTGPLTGTDERVERAVARAAAEHFAAFAAAPPPFDAFALFEEAAPGEEFRLVQRAAFQAPAEM